MAKKTEEVLVKDVKVTYYCDKCGEVAPYLYRCNICKKEICKECQFKGGYSEMTDWRCEPETDYPDRYCKLCWELGKPYREKYRQLKGEHEQELSDVIDQWRGASKT